MDEIQEIKNKYGSQAESIIADGLGLIKKGKKYHCPNTFAHKNGDADPSMSWDPKALQFYCFGCGHKIDLYGYYKEHLNYTHQEIIRDLLGVEDFNKSDMKKNIDIFRSEIKKVQSINKECIDYLNMRGISDDTIKVFNIGTYNHQIAFPYYKYGHLVGYKLRKPLKNPGKPKMTNITGSKPYLFNAQNIDLENKELIICEGEIDCMVISQSGHTNVVSVGAGANSLPALLEQASDFLKKFETIIIVSDNDEAGQNMDRVMVETLGNKAKLIDKKLYKYNDVNDEYYKFGKEKITELIESARFRIEGRWDLDKEPYTGVTPKSGKYIPTGLPSIDYALNDLVPGFTTLITGRSNEGKSTFVRQIIARAIDEGNKVYVMNGEENRNNVVNKIYQCVIGNDKNDYDLILINKRYKKEPKPHILKKLQEWHKGKLVLFNKGDSKLKNMEELTSMLEMEIRINNFNLIVVDNLMSILNYDPFDKYEQQNKFMQRLHDLADNYNCHIVLVLHPNKNHRKGQSMEFENISGASELYNKADNILAVSKASDEEKNTKQISGKVAILKNRDFPNIIEVDTLFDEATEMLVEIDEETGICQTHVFDLDDVFYPSNQKVPW